MLLKLIIIIINLKGCKTCEMLFKIDSKIYFIKLIITIITRKDLIPK